MNSKYRVTNSSDTVNLDLGTPCLQKLEDSRDKRSEELRLYVELTVEAQKLVSVCEGEVKLSNTTETVLVEPHHFTMVATPLTKEFLDELEPILAGIHAADDFEKSLRRGMGPLEPRTWRTHG